MPTTTITTRRIYAPGRTPAAVVTTGPGGRGGGPTLTPPPPPTSQCCCPACVGLECLDRTRFFSGQLLTEADLNNEQSYWLAKSRLHNRFLHGWGVVCGMQVVCSDCEGWVTIKSGYAIDPCGNDIIVCSDYPYNVVKAIQACCTPTQQTSNCAPLRSTPLENCKDPQTWCITIEYQEQPSRLVTPLKKATPKSGTCSCSSSKGGCGCGCSGHGSNGSSASSSNGCSCASTATQSPSIPAGACEPTRINEGYRVCVVPAPTTREILKGSPPGTTGYQIDQGIQELTQLLLQAPQLDPNKLNPITDPQLAYTAVWNYHATLRNYFSSPSVTHCSLLNQLNQIIVPSPPQDTTNYIAQQLVPTMSQLSGVVINSAMQRYCVPLLMPCPPDPCDDRLCLACVTVQNGKVTDICNFGCRHQVFTFQTLYSWLSAFGLDTILMRWKSLLEINCCGEGGRGAFFGPNTFQRQSLTSAGLTNPGMVNQLLSMFVAQKLGSTFVNSAMPPNSQAQTVDLRPLVGLDTETALRSLGSYNIDQQNITATAVDSDPAWNDDAVAAGAQFTPAAFLPIDPLTTNANHLTMYTKGKLVVGFDVTDPVSVLKNQVQQLQQQINQLRGAAGTLGTPATPGTPGTPGGSSPAPKPPTGRGPTGKKN